MSLVNYADDILNLSRSVSGIESNFRVLSNEYANIGLEFNSSKSEVVVFNCRKKELAPVIFALGSNTVTAAASMTYLGLPIGSNLKATRSCLINDLKCGKVVLMVFGWCSGRCLYSLFIGEINSGSKVI